jgi:hypothetical protein
VTVGWIKGSDSEEEIRWYGRSAEELLAISVRPRFGVYRSISQYWFGHAGRENPCEHAVSDEKGQLRVEESGSD